MYYCRARYYLSFLSICFFFPKCRTLHCTLLGKAHVHVCQNPFWMVSVTSQFSISVSQLFIKMVESTRPRRQPWGNLLDTSFIRDTSVHLENRSTYILFPFLTTSEFSTPIVQLSTGYRVKEELWIQVLVSLLMLMNTQKQIIHSGDFGRLMEKGIQVSR